MHRAYGRFAAIASACLVLVFALPAFAQVAPADQQAIEQLVARLYDARALKDAKALAALWASKTAQRSMATFPSDFLFPYQRLEVVRLSLSRVTQDASSVTARAIVELVVTPKAADKPRPERWIRNMAFVKEGDAWMLLRETPAADELAVQISRATMPEERTALLAAEPDLISEELALALESQGDRFFTLGNTRGALAMYDLEISVAERAGSRAGVARAHLKIGQTAQLSPDPDRVRGADPGAGGTATEHFQKALEGFTALGDRERMASAEMGLATISYMQDPLVAREHYQKAIDILEPLPDKFLVANAVHGYGNASFLLGDYAAALDAYRRSMTIDQQEGTRGRLVIPALWQAIGRVQKKQGDYEGALDSYQKSLADHAIIDPGTEYGALTEIADVYRLQGRFELSLDQYGKALAFTQAHKDTQGAMWVEANIGNVYMSEQQPAAALTHYQKSVELAQQLRNQDGVARALAGAGAAYFAEMQNDAALDAFSKALVIREALNDGAGIAWLHAHIGMVHSANDKHDDAIVSFQKALDLSNKLNDAAAVGVMQVLLAAEHADLEHIDQALDLAAKATAVAQATESSDTLARAKVVTARALRKKGDGEGAERALREAVTAVEAGRAKTGDEPRDDFFGDTRGPYRELALLLADAGQTDKTAEALLFAERAHLDLLADVLTGNRSLITAGLSPEEQEAEQRLGRTLRSLHVQIDKERSRPTPDPVRLESLRTKLDEAEQQRSAFDEKIYAAHPALKLQRGFFGAGSFADLAAVVDDGKTVVVELVTGAKQTLAIALTRAAGATKPTAATAAGDRYELRTFTADVTITDLTRRVRDYRTAIRTQDANIGKAGEDLYELLVAPWQSLLAGKTRLIVVPDGPLWSLPFQALQSSDGRYLIQRCAVSYGPSLTALTLLAASTLAPPAGSAARRRVIVIANRQAGSAETRFKLLSADANLAPMPNAEQEARSLAQLYGPSRARVFGGTTAARDAIRIDAANASLLHLATFLAPNAASPLRSPIILSVAKSGEADVLEAWELMRAPMPPLTVVSRVHVDRVGGDGTVPVGLSWVFFVAGTKTAVLATWPDDSPAAVSLMLGLHGNLARPGAGAVGASRALRQAILPLLATKYRHPFYWANYAVIGVG